MFKSFDIIIRRLYIHLNKGNNGEFNHNFKKCFTQNKTLLFLTKMYDASRFLKIRRIITGKKHGYANVVVQKCQVMFASFKLDEKLVI